jgi:anti-sigma factor RsiW
VWHNRCWRGRNDRRGRNDSAPLFQRTSGWDLRTNPKSRYEMRSVKRALAGLGAGVAAVALLAAMTLTASMRSSTLLDNTAPFQPWQETPWSGRATQGLDAQGQDW